MQHLAAKSSRQCRSREPTLSLPTSPLAIAGHPASAEAVAIASTLATDISNTTVAIETTTDKSAAVGDCACP